MGDLSVRFQTLKKASEEISELPGSIAEVGVWRGKAAKYMATLMPGRKIHLFDTFAGMPKDMLLEIDGDHWDKYANNSLARVKGFLSKFDNFEFHPGIFPDTSAELDPQERFCLVNVDLDIYHPTLAACEFFYPRIVAGGIMVLNDYHAPRCKGATKAIDEFFSDKPEEILFPVSERSFVRKRS